MRSRYSAYVLGDTAYLLRTWAGEAAAATRSANDPRSEWLGLQAVRTTEGARPRPRGGRVYCPFRLTGRQGQLHERSRFRHEASTWVYCRR